MSEQSPSRPIETAITAFLRDKGKGDAGESGNYRSDAARELDRFVEWLREEDLGRDPTFDDLDETTDLARNRPNVVSTDLALLSVWRNERLLEAATDCEDGNPGLSNDETDRCGKYSMRVTRSTPVNRRTAIS